MPKTKGPSKRAEYRARVNACAAELAKLINGLERKYQPEIVRGAQNQLLYNQREADRIAREKAALRRREAELDARAARL
jgi:hypothetical protein